MKIMEKFGVREPQWILDKAESGILFWRRDSSGNNKPRVKFQFDVDIKEFCRADHEMESDDSFGKIDDDNDIVNAPNGLVAVMAGFLCIAITIVLPYYVIGTN